ncbi:MmcQ/YjbR family DNA-binding protein [Mariluticola halotolerans]|uniref:MmcQ/YjbR family DNA-binding protein n=1 Tax=Mariluticola halotolerans TaxID=2909283 RepID=UPI0026E1A466|nr:MmcQ/YjbR family DNA-binding protein [Mariluticola halotolerans]UJQ93249.1 MmcQ/YjbR family DNA-binding protein [Mariluticola halotolerans]
MSLFERAEFETFIAGLPAVEIVHQWGDASVGKVGGKIFAILSVWNRDDRFQISFKCSDMSFQLLPELMGVEKAKYLARAKWVQVAPDSALSEDDIAAYIIEAHRIIVGKLPRRVRETLDL